MFHLKIESMKTLKVIISFTVVFIIACSIYQVTAKESFKEVQLKECVNCKGGLFRVVVENCGTTYTGGTVISAGLITGRLKSESVLTLRHKGFFNEIISYK